MDKSICFNISQISTGFVEVPGYISLNIFAQGCNKRCPNCHNPQLFSFEDGEKILLDDIPKILSEYPLSKWVCWLGGDATYQPESFVLFNKEFKKHSNIRICLYTGQLFSEVHHLLDDVDLVIDGEWREELGPISSETTNQKIYVKTCTSWREISFKQLKPFLKNNGETEKI